VALSHCFGQFKSEASVRPASGWDQHPRHAAGGAFLHDGDVTWRVVDQGLEHVILGPMLSRLPTEQKEVCRRVFSGLAYPALQRMGGAHLGPVFATRMHGCNAAKQLTTAASE